jgi:ATP-binding cassette subfamily B protein
MDPEKLMKKISFVFQGVYPFQDIIAGNIRYGRENASPEEIESAAKEASCHDFIMRLPDGYDTHAGEGGSPLSGGEKQRISIARAILKNAPVILLDEAASSLDPENEAEVPVAISRLIQGRTGNYDSAPPSDYCKSGQHYCTG